MSHTSAQAAAEVEVELREDQLENPAMKNKATAGDEPVPEMIDLRSFIREPYLKEIGEDHAEAEQPNSQNKATAGGGEGDPEPPMLKEQQEQDVRVPAPGPAVEKAPPGDTPSQAAETPAAPVRPAAAHCGSDSQPWRELPPWDPMRVSDN
jgi:hypothetical protein